MNNLLKMSPRQLFLMSSSVVHGYEYLQHAENDMSAYLKKNNVNKVLFIPYALTSHDSYTEKVGTVLKRWGFDYEGIHRAADPVRAVNEAQAIYIGGGNTFLLLKSLYDEALIEPIRNRVLNHSVPYVGSSAGTNVATRSIHTTNDMPIICPPSFNALALVPFNINPHYLDPEVGGTHKGETREERILQFHELNDAPVLGLREGSTLLVDGDRATLIGLRPARLFWRGSEPEEFQSGADLSFLLKG
ncbi:probable alpha-aspartyl dipeptidase [Topomyia yanbarensis]|uniref:probable alpha-aspartyl dipeptidase n=1 Tax=Topomyia yanbarensis TaxID=2498891 RepID=UPI00273B6757|nr:probable alpha-aspartyl dipeptidase [Topomyia yanbarensis]XP_058833380.1 probable alpha-aspartyl dipeptidase [Topomyia yanbarensis]XP_058833389.1 probable alpha-aspartyl dipeptidase [Topomyia yanbarensis]XP_058833398.1 probable alpha-aspartyl dipeptidase [Topomyia yanbarensis]